MSEEIIKFGLVNPYARLIDSAEVSLQNCQLPYLPGLLPVFYKVGTTDQNFAS